MKRWVEGGGGARQEWEGMDPKRDRQKLAVRNYVGILDSV